MVALSPAQSPPLVRMPMHLVMGASMASVTHGARTEDSPDSGNRTIAPATVQGERSQGAARPLWRRREPPLVGHRSQPLARRDAARAPLARRLPSLPIRAVGDRGEEGQT